MGFGEIIFIMVVALILFGPEDLPKVARVIGKIIYEIRKLTNDFTKEFHNFIETPVQKKSESEINTHYSGSDISQPDSSQDQPEKSDPLAELPKDMVIVEKKGSGI
ncbi:MAG: twin-arginine translocase TatA/TatE family subunit [Peptococcaceae bacterium]|nr:twin-arginine translocase TatA/TatE family subunit [Peptococcaceae bacterium]